MATLSIPHDGLVLLRTPDSGPPSNSALPLQVMRLSTAQKTTDEILKSFRNREKVSVRFGKRVVIQHGKKSHPVFACPEAHPSELYQRSNNDENTFYFSGKLSHRLETQKAQSDTAKADEALLNLENSLKSYEEQKASNEARFVTDKDELRHLTESISQKGKGYPNQPSAIRKDRLLNTLGRSAGPSSPFLGEAISPAIRPTSAGKLGTASIGKDQIRLNAVKVPFLHLLAVKAATPKVLTETIHATKEDCEKLLHKYAKDVGEVSGRQELKDRAYRELDLWKFPYRDDKDRQAAIDRAISAFDRMRISTSDRIWETLLPTQERGKGKGSELSRLKIGQVGLNGVIPKLGSSQAGSHSVTDTDTDHGKSASKAKAATKTKPRSGTNSSLDKTLAPPKESTKQVKDLQGKENPRKEKKKATSHGKFKSSEVIEDSDEELQAAENSIEDPTKLSKRLTTKAKSSTTIQLSKPTTSASKPPVSSSKPAAPKATSSLMPNSTLGRPRSDSTTNKASPRSRTDSSPQKPSPLALSPPTNATDLDNSQSSKPKSLSSTTASPASPRRDRDQKAAPASNPSESKASSSALKRKAEEQSTSAPKRQQTNGNHVARPVITNGVNKSNRPQSKDTLTTTTTASSSSQRSRTPSSSSSISTSTSTTTSTNTTTKPPTSILQSDLQLKSKSRRFKEQYARYQALHAKMMALPERERDAKEVKVLRKMHDRIGELKREIWEGWESSGGGKSNGSGRGRKG